jgi:hypothetical protein
MIQKTSSVFSLSWKKDKKRQIYKNIASILPKEEAQMLCGFSGTSFAL